MPQFQNAGVVFDRVITNHHHLFALVSLELHQFCPQGFYNMIVNIQKLVMTSL